MCFIFHKWDKWEVIEQGNIMGCRSSWEPHTVGTYLIQKRVCKVCGKTQLDQKEVRL